jgi:hypothetical protein
MRSALFWAITQRAMVIPYRRFGTLYLPNFKGQESKKNNLDRLNVEPVGCPETSVKNYHYTPLNSKKSADLTRILIHSATN